MPDLYGSCRLHGHQVGVTAAVMSSTGPHELGSGVEAASDAEGLPGLPWPGVAMEGGPQEGKQKPLGMYGPSGKKIYGSTAPCEGFFVAEDGAVLGMEL